MFGKKGAIGDAGSIVGSAYPPYKGGITITVVPFEKDIPEYKNKIAAKIPFILSIHHRHKSIVYYIEHSIILSF